MESVMRSPGKVFYMKFLIKLLYENKLQSDCIFLSLTTVVPHFI